MVRIFFTRSARRITHTASSRLNSTGGTTSNVACNNSPWNTFTSRGVSMPAMIARMLKPISPTA
jgi:hypothetical protein